MITTANTTNCWLEHRLGACHHTPAAFQVNRRALELNSAFADLTSFGNREIKGVVGFIDLVGFSASVENSSPQEISAFLQPFLSGVINATTNAQGLVDKSIGDEVMLILPDLEDDGGMAVEFNIQFLLSQLYNLQSNLGSNYRFHMGFSFGSLYLDRVEGKGYSEWTFAGRTIILAKRLAILGGSEQYTGFEAAFGVLSDESHEDRFRSIIRFVANDVSPFECKQFRNPGLKGIKEANCVILARR